ncbi:MAG: WPE palindromic element domain-containing protein [Wolbachia sp.]
MSSQCPDYLDPVFFAISSRTLPFNIKPYTYQTQCTSWIPVSRTGMTPVFLFAINPYS